jgi:RimJ/RimL family protein N-acetyltransferase
VKYLETEHLILRQFTPEDAQNLIELDSDPEVMRHVGGDPTPPDEIRNDILPRFLEYHRQDARFGFWAATLRPTGEFLGWFHLRPAPDPPHEMELGYRLKRSVWSQGYATEGSRALIAKAFDELGVDRIIASAGQENVASWRVMEKAGMHFVERFEFHGPSFKYAIDREG